MILIELNQISLVYNFTNLITGFSNLLKMYDAKIMAWHYFDSLTLPQVLESTNRTTVNPVFKGHLSCRDTFGLRY